MKKKIIYGLGMSVGVFAPIAAVVSCGCTSNAQSQNGNAKNIKALPNYLSALKKLDADGEANFDINEYDFSDLEKERFVETQVGDNDSTKVIAVMYSNDKFFSTLLNFEKFRRFIHGYYDKKVIFLISEKTDTKVIAEAKAVHLNEVNWRETIRQIDYLEETFMNQHQFHIDNRNLPDEKRWARGTVLYKDNKILFDQLRDKALINRKIHSWYTHPEDAGILNEFYDYQFSIIKNVLQSAMGKKFSLGVVISEGANNVAFSNLNFIVPEKIPDNFTELFEFLKTVKKDGYISYSSIEKIYDDFDKT